MKKIALLLLLIISMIFVATSHLTPATGAPPLADSEAPL